MSTIGCPYSSGAVRSVTGSTPGVLTNDVPGLLAATLDQVDPASVTRHKVGKAVGNVRNDSPELAEPVA
jgi:hypothetical protein